jgi:tRNA pseudouridine55 synthase
LELIESGQRSAVSGQPENEDQKPKTEDRRIRVACSAGTYIRTLAEDIGRRLETGAHLAELRRTRAGKFDLSRASTLEELEEIAAENKLDEVLISMNEALSQLPEIKLSPEEARKTQNGMKLRFEAAKTADNQPFRLIDESENLIAVGFYDEAEKTVQPKVVLV